MLINYSYIHQKFTAFTIHAHFWGFYLLSFTFWTGLPSKIGLLECWITLQRVKSMLSILLGSLSVIGSQKSCQTLTASSQIPREISHLLIQENHVIETVCLVMSEIVSEVIFCGWWFLYDERKILFMNVSFSPICMTLWNWQILNNIWFGGFFNFPIFG